MGFFTEPAFFIALIPVIGIACVLGIREKPLAPWGFICSLLFLGALFARTPQSLIYLLCYLAGSVALMMWIQRQFTQNAPKAVLCYRIALALQIAPLVIYKIGIVFMPGFLGFIGISYITFKAVQVLIEIRDGLIKDFKVIDYLYFLVFFPTFTSGPILRSRRFSADIAQTLAKHEYLTMLYRGIGWLILGALYKFIGAACASWLMWFAPSAIGTSSTLTFVLTQIVYAFAYGLYMFFDFAGYSHMAMGVGYALGIDVPRNFKAPFAALDIKDFWNRWHISLSTWLRDFVFMRFSGWAMRNKIFKSRLTVANLGFILNMTLMGVWHGISLANITYGIYHGLLLAACETYQKKSKFYKAHRKQTWFKLMTWAITMIAVFFGLAFFSGQVFNPIYV